MAASLHHQWPDLSIFPFWYPQGYYQSKIAARGAQPSITAPGRKADVGKGQSSWLGQIFLEKIAEVPPNWVPIDSLTIPREAGQHCLL
jgi:hypothetical protein